MPIQADIIFFIQKRKNGSDPFMRQVTSVEPPVSFRSKRTSLVDFHGVRNVSLRSTERFGSSAVISISPLPTILPSQP